MKNYKYSPFNVFSIIILMLYILYIVRMIKESNKSIDILKILFSPIILYPILALIIWLIDYYFQKNNTNFKKLFLVELIFVLILFSYFIYGLTNIF